LIKPLDRLIVNFVLSLASPGGPGGGGGGEVCLQTLAVMTLLLFTPG